MHIIPYNSDVTNTYFFNNHNHKSRHSHSHSYPTPLHEPPLSTSGINTPNPDNINHSECMESMDEHEMSDNQIYIYKHYNIILLYYSQTK